MIYENSNLIINKKEKSRLSFWLLNLDEIFLILERPQKLRLLTHLLIISMQNSSYFVRLHFMR